MRISAAADLGFCFFGHLKGGGMAAWSGDEVGEVGG